MYRSIWNFRQDAVLVRGFGNNIDNGIGNEVFKPRYALTPCWYRLSKVL